LEGDENEVHSYFIFLINLKLSPHINAAPAQTAEKVGAGNGAAITAVNTDLKGACHEIEFG